MRNVDRGDVFLPRRQDRRLETQGPLHHGPLRPKRFSVSDAQLTDASGVTVGSLAHVLTRKSAAASTASTVSLAHRDECKKKRLPNSDDGLPEHLRFLSLEQERIAQSPIRSVVSPEPPLPAITKLAKDELTPFTSNRRQRLIEEADTLLNQGEALRRNQNAPQFDLEGDLEPSSAPECVADSRKKELAQRALLLQASGKYREAILVSSVIEPTLYGRLARTYLGAHMYDDALTYVNRARSFFPSSARLALMQGQIFLGLRRSEDAIGAFDEAVSLGQSCDESESIDMRLLNHYQKLAGAPKRTRPFGPHLGALEIQSSSEVQRELDGRLNPFNLYESASLLLQPESLPNIEHPSRLVNPIYNRLTSKPPILALPVLSTSTSTSLPDAPSTEENKPIPAKKLLPPSPNWREDLDGSVQDEVLIEMEIETRGEVLDLVILKNDDAPSMVEDFLARHSKLLSVKQRRDIRKYVLNRTEQARQEAILKLAGIQASD